MPDGSYRKSSYQGNHPLTDPLVIDRPRPNSFQDKDKDAMFYPAIITEKIKLYLDETELIERRLRDWNLLGDRHLTETLIKESSDLDSM